MRQLAQTLNRSKNVLNVCVDLDLLLPLVVSDSQRLGFSRVQSGALPKKKQMPRRRNVHVYSRMVFRFAKKKYFLLLFGNQKRVSTAN